VSRRLDRWRGRLAADQPELVVCRGGDCGSRRKHPQLDHVAQLARIRERLRGERVTVTVSKCLDECEFSNVCVVLPGRTARDAGAEAQWIGRVLDEEATDAVIALAGGGATPDQPVIEAHRFTPTRRARQDPTIRRSGRAR
jgi:(2Fe-2S) ferredoxin